MQFAASQSFVGIRRRLRIAIGLRFPWIQVGALPLLKNSFGFREKAGSGSFERSGAFATDGSPLGLVKTPLRKDPQSFAKGKTPLRKGPKGFAKRVNDIFRCENTF
jgi:hypothetical protein